MILAFIPSFLAKSILLSLTTAQADITARPNVTYVPSTTKVAILPAVNADGEKDPKRAQEEGDWVDSEVLKEFRERGFRIVKLPAIQDAIKKADVDLGDDEQRKRATMIQVGKDVGADLVVFALITDKSMTSAKKVATVKFWLLGVNQEAIWLSAKPVEGRSNFSNRFNLARWNRAFEFTARGALEDFMKDYKSVPPADQDQAKG